MTNHDRWISEFITLNLTRVKFQFAQAAAWIPVQVKMAATKSIKLNELSLENVRPDLSLGVRLKQMLLHFMLFCAFAAQYCDKIARWWSAKLFVQYLSNSNEPTIATYGNLLKY